MGHCGCGMGRSEEINSIGDDYERNISAITILRREMCAGSLPNETCNKYLLRHFRKDANLACWEDPASTHKNNFPLVFL